MSASADLHAALKLLDQALDGTAAETIFTDDELDLIRVRRANQMFEAARRLHSAIVKTVHR